MNGTSTNQQRGAVSLFVVIFAMLLITVITVSFLRLMITDQRQATDNDLSQSAYDSAQAGVEDAKRALLRYQQICNNDPASCGALSDQLSTTECNAGLRIGNVVKPGDESSGTPSQTGEIIVQQSDSGDDTVLNQAYTCVVIQLETEDYIGSITAGASQLVPLVGKDGYDTVTIRWFNQENITSTDGSVTLPGVTSTHPFVAQTSWSANTPSLMRAQLIQYGSSFRMTDFDAVNGSGESNANTVFLFPTSGAGATSGSFTGLDTRSTGPTDYPDADNASTTAHPVRCSGNISAGGYACSMSLTVPTPIGGGNRTAFLRLTPFYNTTEFQVVLSNGVPTSTGNNIVKFKDVEPMIDSTGRANDIFRRIQSRVELYNTDFPYPDATIDITGNFCKNFAVSNIPDTYTTTNTCTP